MPFFPSRRELILGASATLAVAGMQVSSAAESGPALRDIAHSNGFLYGAAFATVELGDRAATKLYSEQSGILVPDFELKWGAVRPSRQVYNLAPADQLLSFAKAHGMAFRGHNLIWEESNPAWLGQLISSVNAEQLLREHIETVVQHFAGQVHSWDVVNEPIWPQHGKENGLRDGIWLRSLGEEYIDLAFRVARSADPHALLVLNEAGTESASAAGHQRRELFLKLIDRLLDRGVPLDAVGLECHFGTQSHVMADDFGSYLEQLSKRGLKIIISELDVSDLSMIAAPIADRDKAVAAIYDTVVATATHNPATIAVLTWELFDKYSWLKDSAHPQGLPPRPLPYDLNLTAKLARVALANGLATKRHR